MRAGAHHFHGAFLAHSAGDADEVGLRVEQQRRIRQHIADEELHPCDAQWSGLYDRMHTHEDDETARRFQIAADSGGRVDG